MRFAYNFGEPNKLHREFKILYEKLDQTKTFKPTDIEDGINLGMTVQEIKDCVDFMNSIGDKVKFPDSLNNKCYGIIKPWLDTVGDMTNITKDEIEIFLNTHLNVTYKELVESSAPTEVDTSLYIDFDTYMHKLDPVSGFLESNFGKDFAKTYVDKFLFPYHTKTKV
jgi:hypothetical protein